MPNTSPITSLSELLERIEESTEDDNEVSIGKIAEAIGSRSFGPMLLIPALVMIAPGVGDIPGVTTAMAIVVFVIAIQLMFRRKHLWLPQWLLNRSISRERITKTTKSLSGVAGWVDRLIRHRMETFASGRAIAIGCVLVSLVMPLMEVVPFGGMVAGAALGAYALALIANDGLLALFAYVATVAAFSAGIYFLL